MKDKMIKALNEQIREELASAYLYLAIAADMDAQNLTGAATWMKVQYSEEVGHAMKIYGYINQRDGKVTLETLEAPKGSWKSIAEAFEAALKHEKHITGRIEGLVALARELKDTATEVFLQWFVTEQVEEEENTRTVAEQAKMIGDSVNGTFMLDHHLGERQG